MNINDNDVKVLGRVVAITTENKVAEAEQVWDGKFSYNFGGETLGATDQHTINELFAGKILALDAAGLISNGDTLNITKNINFANGKGISLNKINGNLTVTGKLTANSAQIDGKLTAQEIEIDDLTVNNSLTGAENASLNWNGPVNIDGNVKVIGGTHTVRIDGDLSAGSISGPKATTAKYGVVRLATGLDDPDANDVVTVATMKDCCDDVKARLDALEEAIRNFKYSVVNHSSVATLNFGDPEKGTIIIGPGETAKNAMRGTDVHPLFVASPNPGSELDYISKCKVYVERNGIPELRHSVENILVTTYDITEYLSPVTGTIHVYATIGEEETAVWDVIKNGQHVTIGGPDEVEDGNSGEWPITPNSGYKIDSVTVRMGDDLMPSSAWDGTKVSIPSVTGDVTITVVTSAIEPTPGTIYTVTKNISNGTITGNSTAEDGSTYTATVTPDANYQIDSVTVTMGGNTVPGAYNAETGTITVNNVSGNIVITVVTSRSQLNPPFDEDKTGILFLGNSNVYGYGSSGYGPGTDQDWDYANVELNSYLWQQGSAWSQYDTKEDALSAATLLYNKIQITTEPGDNMCGTPNELRDNPQWSYDGTSLFTVEKYIVNLNDTDVYSVDNRYRYMSSAGISAQASDFTFNQSAGVYKYPEYSYETDVNHQQTDTKALYKVGVRVSAKQFPSEMLPNDRNDISFKGMYLKITIDDETITVPVAQYTVNEPLYVTTNTVSAANTIVRGHTHIIDKHVPVEWEIMTLDSGTGEYVYIDPSNYNVSVHIQYRQDRDGRSDRIDVTSTTYDGQHTISMQDPDGDVEIYISKTT